MALSPLAVAPFPILKITLISAVLTSYQVTGTGYYLVTVQGNAQFQIADGAATEGLLSNGFQNEIADGAVSEVVSFST